MKQAIIDPINNLITIKFNMPDRIEWKSTLDFIRGLTGRSFNVKTKIWSCPALDENIQKLKQAGFTKDGKEVNTTPIAQPIVIDNKPQEKFWLSIKVDSEKFKLLRPYQIECLQFLIWRNGRALIGDEMGTGKTVQSLSYLKQFPEKRPVLIVCPASITLQWKREFSKWAGAGPIDILRGRKPYTILPTRSYIINWSIIQDWEEALQKIPFRVVIGDEIQAIGNHTSQRTKAFRKLAKKIPEFLGMSGTPIRSCPAQFFTTLQLLNSDLFPNQYKYLQRYCAPKYNGFGWDYRGSSNEAELHQLIQPLMIRRVKADVMKDLPAKVRSVIPLEVEINSEYSDKEQSFYEGETNGKNWRDILENLVWSAYHLKEKKCIEWIKEFIESGEKLVVFGYHRAVIETLMSHFNGIAVKVDGSTKNSERDQNITRFINDPDCKLFIGNIIAAGVGIDGLQKVCSNVAFVELSWVPSDLLQCEDRLHRMGQKGSVNVYYLLAPGTIEDDIMELVDKKMKTIEAVVDGSVPTDDELLGELIKRKIK